MQFLCNMMNSKLTIEDQSRQGAIDIELGSLKLSKNVMALIREWLYPKRLEIHQAFEQISNERKRFVNIAVRFAAQLFCEFKASDQVAYDLSIDFQFNFINEILSLPTINKYFIPMLEDQSLVVDLKRLYQSFYYSKLTSQNEEEVKHS